MSMDKQMNRRKMWMGWVAGLVWIASCAGAAEPLEVFRFGTAAIGAPLPHRFLLPNEGAETLAVQSAVSSCDCTQVLQWPAEVAAGSTGIVEILLVPDQIGEVDYRVFLQTSASDPSEIEFAIQGEVVAAAPLGKAARDMSLYLGADKIDEVLKDPDSVAWVDVRSPEAYELARIPSSLQIPLFAVKTKGFLRTRPVVLVDEGFGSSALEEACRKLRAEGFRQASIWYGGMNAWQRLGGRLEGSARSELGHVPPAAVREMDGANDWLVVAVGEEAPSPPFEGIATIPFDVSEPDGFVAAINAMLADHPEVACVLIGTQTGEGYDALAETADKIDAYAFYLEGGWTALTAHRHLLDAVQPGRTVVVQGTSSSGGTPRRSSGCRGCSGR